MDYVVVIHPAEEGGFWVEVPALDGCFAQGESIEEALEDARGAIQSHLEALAEDGATVPGPESGIVIATVRVASPAA